MSTIIAQIHNSTVYQQFTNGVEQIWWTSGADIDADGANSQAGGPFAYRFDNKGLDTLADAGYPHGGWRNVFEVDSNGNPKDDGNGNILSMTTYLPAVDAWSVSYVVANPLVRKRAKGIVIGCRATIRYNDKHVEAVVADIGPEWKIGEISIAAAKLLGIPDSPRTGGVGFGVTYNLYPGTPAVVNGLTYSLQPML